METKYLKNRPVLLLQLYFPIDTIKEVFKNYFHPYNII